MVSTPTLLDGPRVFADRVVEVVPWADALGDRPGYRLIKISDLEGARLATLGHTPEDGDPWVRVERLAARGAL